MRIKEFSLAVITAFILLSVTNLPAKEEVYRWVDKNGVVHFGSRAPNHTEAEKVKIYSDRSSDAQTGSAAMDDFTGEEAESEVSFAEQRREERAEKRKEAREKEKLRAAECATSRNVVAQLEPRTRVMVRKADGTVVRMDDNDRLERLREEKAYIAKNCNK